MSGGPAFLDFANFMVILILSTALHELAHAWLATRFGDDTPARHGRLTFNPIPHLDPFFSVMLPAVLYWQSGGDAFMAAAWTPVNPFRMRRPRLHGMLTALGGPTTNFLLAFVAFLFLSAFIVAAGRLDTVASGGQRVAWLAVRLNLFLGIFNFLPVPPLDGASVIPLVLPNRYQAAYWRFRQYSWVVFVVLMLTGVLEMLIVPPLRAATGAAALGARLVERVFCGG